jgi:hypothetical protein
MANEQNLHPSEYKLSQEEAKKGGIRSGQVRREKADFKKKCQIWMESEVAKDKKGKPVTGADLRIAVAGRGIKNGSTKFWELMRDTAGYKPIDKVMVSEVDQSIIDEVEAAVLGVDDDDERTSN